MLHRKYRLGPVVATALAAIFDAMVSPSASRAQTADTMDYYELWNAARVAVERAEFNPDRQQRDSLFAEAEAYARRAVAVRPDDARGHFELARWGDVR